MPDLGYIARISRPRFWFYLFGPYIVGLAAGADKLTDVVTLPAALMAIYFLFPANLLIYGINDIFDYETDRLNAKKADYEVLVPPDRRRLLWVLIAASNIPFIAAAAVFAPQAIAALAGFLFFSVFYSAPPVRAKTKPFLDSAFNILYAFPGAFAYQMLTGSFPPAGVMLASLCWVAAMHAFSAVPDIEADRKAGLSTIATVLGPRGTIIACTFLYIVSAAVSSPYLRIASVTLGAGYVLLMLAALRSLSTGRLFKIYKAFPLINAAAGFVLFWQIVLNK